MKLEIWEDRGKDAPVYLRLVVIDGEAILTVVSKDGRLVPGGYVLGIRPNGMLHRFAHVAHQLGFCLDNRGCILDEEKGGAQ